jgi:hypothetical protein
MTNPWINDYLFVFNYFKPEWCFILGSSVPQNPFQISLMLGRKDRALRCWWLQASYLVFVEKPFKENIIILLLRITNILEFLLGVKFIYCYVECRYVECLYAECRSAIRQVLTSCNRKSISANMTQIYKTFYDRKKFYKIVLFTTLKSFIKLCHVCTCWFSIARCRHLCYGATALSIMTLNIMTFSITINQSWHPT